MSEADPGPLPLRRVLTQARPVSGRTFSDASRRYLQSPATPHPTRSRRPALTSPEGCANVLHLNRCQVRSLGAGLLMTTFSRRELIRRGTALGTLLAVPAAADATAQTTSAAAAKAGAGTSVGGRRLPVDRRPAAHQRPRHLHDHQRLDDAAGGARRRWTRRHAVRASRRARRGGRRPPRDAHRRRVGPRLERLLRRPDARDRRVRRRRQSRSARPPARPERLREGRGDHPDALAQRLRRGASRRRRARRRGLDAGGVRGGARSADRADLHPGRPARRRRARSA